MRARYLRWAPRRVSATPLGLTNPITFRRSGSISAYRLGSYAQKPRALPTRRRSLAPDGSEFRARAGKDRRIRGMPVVPGTVAPPRTVPHEIVRPDYVGKDAPEPYTGPEVKDEQTIERSEERRVGKECGSWWAGEEGRG